MRHLLTLTIAAALAACDGNAVSKSDLDAVRAENAALRQSLQSLQAQVTQLQSQLAATTPVTDAAAKLEAVMTIDDAGDLVIEGVNVQIRNGPPGTSVNGKGNLIIGQNRLPVDCSSGTCVPVPSPARGGSHNLVVGDGHQYAAAGSVLFGKNNTATADACSVLGGQGNIASAFSSVVVAGGGNTASGESSVVLGGDGNKAAGFFAATLAGQGNSTTGQYATAVGGHANAAATDYSVVP